MASIDSATANHASVDIEKRSGTSDHGTLFEEKEGDKIPQDTPLKKLLIMIILCSAQFFDVFNSVSAVIALPQVCLLSPS